MNLSRLFQTLSVPFRPWGAKIACIEGLLREHGELYGQEIVKLSNGLITRGSVFVYLSYLAEDFRVKSRPEPNPAPGCKPRHLFSAVSFREQVADSDLRSFP